MIELTPDQMSDLLTILGAARPLFNELAKQPETPGMIKALVTQYADRTDELSAILIEQYNKKSTANNSK